MYKWALCAFKVDDDTSDNTHFLVASSDNIVLSWLSNHDEDEAVKRIRDIIKSDDDAVKELVKIKGMLNTSLNLGHDLLGKEVYKMAWEGSKDNIFSKLSGMTLVPMLKGTNSRSKIWSMSNPETLGDKAVIVWGSVINDPVISNWL